MALVLCPECQKVVSTEAKACPQCAFPFPGKKPGQEKTITSLMEPSETCPDCHSPVSEHAPSCSLSGGNVTEDNGTQLQDQNVLPDTNGTSLLEPSEMCLDCHSPVSEHAPSCSQNDSSLTNTNGNHSLSNESAEETWLCPHCRMPYTRKVRSAEEGILSENQEVGTSFQDLKLPEISEKPEIPIRNQTNWVARPGLHRRSPLWQSSSAMTAKKEESYAHYPRIPKRLFTVGILFVVLVAILGLLGAIWVMKGLNPLEALVYWQM